MKDHVDLGGGRGKVEMVGHKSEPLGHLEGPIEMQGKLKVMVFSY